MLKGVPRYQIPICLSLYVELFGGIKIENEK